MDWDDSGATVVIGIPWLIGVVTILWWIVQCVYHLHWVS